MECLFAAFLFDDVIMRLIVESSQYDYEIIPIPLRAVRAVLPG
jgi:hypothetical protein